MAWLSIRTITCENTQEGKDEVYVRVILDNLEPNQIWGPRRMDDGNSIEIDWRSREGFSTCALIQLYEQDRGRDDLIGSVYVTATEQERQYRFEGRGARYRIAYGVAAEGGLYTYPITLTRMRCNDAKGTRDDVYLLWNGERIWGPVRMRTGDTQPINHTIFIRERGTLSLWEQDYRNSDHLGTNDLVAEEVMESSGGPLHFRWRKSNRRDAHYTLYYEG